MNTSVRPLKGARILGDAYVNDLTQKRGLSVVIPRTPIPRRTNACRYVRHGIRPVGGSPVEFKDSNSKTVYDFRIQSFDAAPITLAAIEK